jgi:hypothetical protein
MACRSSGPGHQSEPRGQARDWESADTFTPATAPQIGPWCAVCIFGAVLALYNLSPQLTCIYFPRFVWSRALYMIPRISPAHGWFGPVQIGK